MKKQEAIKRVEQMGEFERFVDEPVSKKSVLDIISLIDEPQKVAVPKFVAEWIKRYRHAHTLLRVLSAVESKQVTPSTVSDWILDNQYDFIKAWFDGYDIEKEESKVWLHNLPMVKSYENEILCPDCGKLVRVSENHG